MRLVFTIVFALGFVLSEAQTVKVSKESRVNRNLRFQVLGKNSLGIVVNKYNRTDNEISVYDNNAKETIRKSIPVPPGGDEIKTLLLTKTGATVFYLEREKKQSFLKAWPLDKKFNYTSKPTVIDSFEGGKELIASNLRYNKSGNKSRILFYYPEFDDGDLIKIRAMVLNPNGGMENIWEADFRKGDDLQVVKSLITNNGAVSMVLKEQIPKKSSEKNVYNLSFVYTSPNSTDLLESSTTLPSYVSEKVNFTLHPENKELIISGFFEDELDEDQNTGVYRLIIDLEEGSVINSTFKELDDQTINKLSVNNQKSQERPLDFKIKKVVPKMDGGTILLAEHFYTQYKEVRSNTMMYPSVSSFRTVALYHYLDILAVSISKEGDIEWFNVLPKRQITEEDNGAYSSFSIMNTASEIRLIFLDEIYENAGLYEYIVNEDGSFKKKWITNQNNENVMAVAKLAKQVSPDEMIIPSYKNGGLKLIKINY